MTREGLETASEAQIESQLLHHAITLDAITLEGVQASLILSIYQWGMGRWRKAWIISGMAIRMIQALLRSEHTTYSCQREQQIYNRTLWSCFVVERLIVSGLSQPYSLSCSTMRTHWPCSEEGFIFGQSSSDLKLAESGPQLLHHMQGDMAHYYATLVRGFDIWGRILTWVTSGGRRNSEMTLPQNHPWAATSPWMSLREDLRSWRSHYEDHLLYPEFSVRSHVALGQVEPFVFLNLLYYVSSLFLGREYMPFLPTNCSAPSGPVDPPLLPLGAPNGWWLGRADEFFVSANRISEIIRDLDNAGKSLLTPFAGFCLFSAITTNMYASAFPWMVPRIRNDISEIIARDIEKLESLQHIWHIGEGWLSTIQRCKRLYARATLHPSELSSRSRHQHCALYKAIHDCRGQAPMDEPAALPSNESESAIPSDDAYESQQDQGQWFMSYVDGSDDSTICTNLDWNQLWPSYDFHYDPVTLSTI
ncbi:hypothetical protein GQ44DRAFT_628638 [Phaeosphaeriaceae sp. PMI808]|nr:hypothetical protein GQ44DRAFT_628638 [Phaeosphaeriaceae sp. PMI808]